MGLLPELFIIVARFMSRLSYTTCSNCRLVCKRGAEDKHLWKMMCRYKILLASNFIQHKMMYEYRNPRIDLHYVEYDRIITLRNTNTCIKFCVERIHHKNNALVEFRFRECFRMGSMVFYAVIVDNSRIVIDTISDPLRTRISIYCKHGLRD
jgi:hypothetical protein